MFKKLFGFRIVSKENFDKAKNNEVERIKLVIERDRYKLDSDSLKERIAKINNHSLVEHIELDLGDPSPVKKEEREIYVARVAGLHKDILKDKLKQMISSIHTAGEDENLQRRTEWMLKGAVYAFREFIAWGDSMINEHIKNESEKKTK